MSVLDALSDAPARLRRLLTSVLTMSVVACSADGVTPTARNFPVRFQVSNALVAPVTISVDGAAVVILTGGRGAGLTVPSSAQWLTWTSAKPMDATGRPIPDDVGEVRVAVSGIQDLLEITNVIGDQKYITAGIFNRTNAQVSIGVFDGAAVSCAAVLPAADRVSGFVQIGYYRLLPTTEVRAYRDPSRCIGPYISWPKSELAGFTPKSGLLTLVLESAP